MTSPRLLWLTPLLCRNERRIPSLGLPVRSMPWAKDRGLYEDAGIY